MRLFWTLLLVLCVVQQYTNNYSRVVGVPTVLVRGLVMKVGAELYQDFPILREQSDSSPFIYLDNAATSLTPEPVIRALNDYYTAYGTNIHRGAYARAEATTLVYEQARAAVAEFIGASPDEIIITQGATAAINTVTRAWGATAIQPGDQIWVTVAEHHANFVPWQQLAIERQAELVVVPITTEGMLDYDFIADTMSERVKVIALSHVSNVIGAFHDLAYIRSAADAVGAVICLDGAQSIGHVPINVRELGADFFAFSAHKMLGPTGVGILYVARHLHDALKPYQYGGNMIYSVSALRTTWASMPSMLEAGTPPIAAMFGLGAAINYIHDSIDFDALSAYEASLCSRFIDGLKTIRGATFYGCEDLLRTKGHLVSFSIEGIHPHDIADKADHKGICIRAGSHCAQPLHAALDVYATARASMHAYTRPEDIDLLLNVLTDIRQELGT